MHSESKGKDIWMSQRSPRSDAETEKIHSVIRARVEPTPYTEILTNRHENPTENREANEFANQLDSLAVVRQGGHLQ